MAPIGKIELKSRTIHSRLLSALIPVVLGGGFVLLISFGISLYLSLSEQQKRNVVELATQHSRSMDTLLWNYDHQSIRVIVDSLATQADVLNVRVFDDEGSLIRASGDFESVVAGSVFRVEQDITHTQGTREINVGRLEISANPSQLNRQLMLELSYYGLILVLVTLVLVVVTYRTSEKLVRRPLSMLLESIKHVDERGERRRVDFQGDDELGAVINAFNDMLDKEAQGRQELEQEIDWRHQAQQELNTEKERFEVTLQSIGDGVISCDIAGNIDYMNPVAEKLTGWSLEEIRGKPIQDVYRTCFAEIPDIPLNPVRECLTNNEFISHASHIQLSNRQGQQFHVRDSVAPIRDSTEKVVGAVLIFSDISESMRLVSELEHQAKHDALTGLVNRREFEARLQRLLLTARDGEREHALCYIDLDRFKVVNDSCGHVAGDELLRQIAELFSRQVRRRDTLARLGGDEFGVLMEHCSIDQAMRVAQHLVKVTSEFQFVWENQTFKIGASIGLVSVNKDSGALTRVMGTADMACYKSKKNGRNQVTVLRPDEIESTKRSHNMHRVAQINRSLKENSFQLFYQPIVPTQLIHADDPPIHFELLLRMEDDDGKILEPAHFLPIADRYNLCSLVDRWVVENSIQWLSEQSELEQQSYWCSINLSGQSLADSQWMQYLLDWLKKQIVDPRHLCFEVTETSAIANLSAANRLMTDLKEIGCMFALDDFGSALSSFTYLKHLPVDFLKIDGSLIKDVNTDPFSRAMVTAINEISHVIDRKTVAEFVENEQILKRLADINVDYLQGFAIGVPLPIETFEVQRLKTLTANATSNLKLLHRV